MSLLLFPSKLSLSLSVSPPLFVANLKLSLIFVYYLQFLLPLPSFEFKAALMTQRSNNRLQLTTGHCLDSRRILQPLVRCLCHHSLLLPLLLLLPFLLCYCIFRLNSYSTTICDNQTAAGSAWWKARLDCQHQA